MSTWIPWRRTSTTPNVDRRRISTTQQGVSTDDADGAGNAGQAAARPSTPTIAPAPPFTPDNGGPNTGDDLRGARRRADGGDPDPRAVDSVSSVGATAGSSMRDPASPATPTDAGLRMLASRYLRDRLGLDRGPTDEELTDFLARDTTTYRRHTTMAVASTSTPSGGP